MFSLLDLFLNVLGQSLLETVSTVASFLPNAIIAAITFALGWVFGPILGRAMYHLVAVLRIDNALHKAGLDTVSDRAGIRISLAGFLSGLIKWTVIVAFTMAAAEMVNLSQVTQLLHDILWYIPQVIIAVIVIVISILVGDFVARLVSHSTKATGTKGEFASKVAKWSIIVVGGVFPALTQLRIAQGLVEVLFTGVVFALSLALGLAFGLGGRDAAARAIEKMQNNQ